MEVIVDTNFFRHKKIIQKIFKDVLFELKVGDITVALSLNYVNTDRIRMLNLKHRNLDQSTDVLSFPLNNINEGKKLAKFVDFDTKIATLGDIVICKQFVRTQARSCRHSFKREVCFLALHGFLHLLGFDHTLKEEDEKMCALADKILIKNGVGK